MSGYLTDPLRALGYTAAMRRLIVVALLAAGCTSSPGTNNPAAPSSPTATTPAPSAPVAVQAIAIAVTAGQSPGTVGIAESFYAYPIGIAPTAPTLYTFTFGDGQTGSSATGSLTHPYASAGTYPVSVTVTDGQGRTASASTVASIIAPTPAATTPSGGSSGSTTPTAPSLSVDLNCTAAAHGSASTCNVTLSLGGSIVTSQLRQAVWDWGAGVDPYATALPYETFKYPAAGTYTVVVRVTLNDGKTATAQKVLTVT